MNVNATVEGSKATVEIEGKLTVNAAPSLRSLLDTLPEEVCDIDIDLSKTSYIASTGLRILVAADKLAHERGGRVRLLHPTEEVRRILEIVGLLEVIAVED